LLCADVNRHEVQETVEQVNAINVQKSITGTKVHSRPTIDGMIDTSERAFGEVDPLFISVGSAVRLAGFMKMNDVLWRKACDINVNEVFYGTQASVDEHTGIWQGHCFNMAGMAHKHGCGSWK